MSEPTEDRPKESRNLVSLFAFIVICLIISGIGGAITASSVETWYQALEKPIFNPPDWVFAPVWTLLYIIMGIAAWRVWRLRSFEATGKALGVFALQLGFNLAWSFLFFGLQRIDLALVEIVILLVAIIVNAIMFWRIDRLAGLMLMPYIAWVTYATILNASLWLLN
ncbi:tryptophan-rich sensory protein [Alphaproteobacteria bacterium]|nr:tryptophan-rich sensory protein [Alphaproteobacteria bacterium]